MDLAHLVTPAFLIDLDRFQRNAETMKQVARRFNVQLRPHVKTHKTLEGARIQVDPDFSGITVSTLAEARFFGLGGFDDVVYAIPIAPDRLHDAHEIALSGVRLTLVLDHPETFRAVEAFCRHQNHVFPVFLKVDCGSHRCGVDPDHPDSLALAKALHASSHLDFQGILTHAGHAYAPTDSRHLAAIACDERDIMRRFADVLRREGVRIRTVSIGSTPSLRVIDHLDGIDEIRPGNYVLFDASQVQLGTCRLEDCAASVWASVIGQYPQQNRLVVDAGALALSKDSGIHGHQTAPCFGVLADTPQLTVSHVTQEHGCITGSQPIDFSRFPIGSKVSIIPSHSCLAAACFAAYHVVSEGRIVDTWHPIRGW